MKLLLVLLLATSCYPVSRTLIQDQINSFSAECIELSKCMDATHSININLKHKSPFTCKIHTTKKDKEYHSYGVVQGVDIIKEPPAFGHLGNLIELCKYLKQKGFSSKKNVAERIGYSRCLDRKANGEFCWFKYKNGDFTPKD